MVEQASSDPSAFHTLVGMALTDHTYRQALKDRTQQREALQAAGIDPTEDALTALNDAIDALDRLSEQFGGGTAAA